MSLRDRVIPYLRSLEPILTDPDVTDVMVIKGGQRVYIEKHGRVRLVPELTVETKALSVAIKNIARGLGEDWSANQPILDSRLEDGSRVAAVGEPVAVDGPTLTIRRFGRRYSLTQLIDAGMLSAALATSLVADLVITKRTILIVGGTGTGKTTVLNALADQLPEHDRILLLEDTAEIYLARENLVRLTTVRGSKTVEPVTMTDLLRLSLRHRPDRIIVGEVRGAEAFDLLQALNTGHQGSLSTLHANSALEALSRFAFCVQQSGVAVPYDTVCSQIAATGCVVVYISRVDGQRRVVDCLTALGYSPRDGWITAPILLNTTSLPSLAAEASRNGGASEGCSAAEQGDTSRTAVSRFSGIGENRP